MIRANTRVRRRGSAQIWRAVAAVSCLALLACGESPYAQQFEQVWRDVDQTYPYFGVKGVDWSAIRDTYRARAESVQSEEALARVLVEMLGGLRDLHVVLVAPNGQVMPTWGRDVFRNYDVAVWSAYARRWGVQDRGNWGYGWIAGVPYVYVASWGAPLDGFDAALEQFRSAPGLVIDIRMNGGGNTNYALPVAERLADRTRLGGYARFRNGPGHDDFTAPAAGYFSPGGSWQFTKPVLLLIGRGAVSTSEDFTSGLRELPHVTLAGDPTGGSTGNPATHPLADGWSYRISQWFFTTPDGIVVEDHGIPPHVTVAASAADFAAGKDPVLDYAEAWAAAPRTIR